MTASQLALLNHIISLLERLQRQVMDVAYDKRLAKAKGELLKVWDAAQEQEAIRNE